MKKILGKKIAVKNSKEGKLVRKTRIGANFRLENRCEEF